MEYHQLSTLSKHLYSLKLFLTTQNSKQSWPRKFLSLPSPPSRSSLSLFAKTVSIGNRRAARVYTDQYDLVRDNYDSKKEEIAAQASKLVGTPFVINFNPNQVMAYATDSSTTGGYIFAG